MASLGEIYAEIEQMESKGHIPIRLTYGVPARNVQDTLVPCLESFVLSASRLPALVESIDVLVCVNGCDKHDRTEENLDAYIERASGNIDPRISFVKLASEPGKMNAQRKILGSSRGDIVFFFDSDILFHPDSVPYLWSDFALNPTLQTSYAEPRSVKPRKRLGAIEEFWYDVFSIGYRVPGLFGNRNYLCGRFFGIRDPWFPAEEEIRARMRRTKNAYSDTRFDLKLGPLVDDIFWTYYTYHKYCRGHPQLFPHVLKNNKQSEIYFVPPFSFREFYRDSKRTCIEVDRLLRLYPEWSWINPHFEKPLHRDIYDSLPFTEKMALKVKRNIEKRLNGYIAKCTALMGRGANVVSGALRDLWPCPSSTGPSFPRELVVTYLTEHGARLATPEEIMDASYGLIKVVGRPDCSIRYITDIESTRPIGRDGMYDITYRQGFEFILCSFGSGLERSTTVGRDSTILPADSAFIPSEALYRELFV